MDIEAHQHPAESWWRQSEAAVLDQRHAAGFEIGRIYGVVDVLIGVEIGKAHIVGQAVGKIFQARRWMEAGWCVHGRSPKVSRSYNPVVEPRPGVAVATTAILW